MTREEQNKALVRDHYEQVTNRKNLAAVDEQIAPDFVDHEAPPHLPPGPEGARRWLTAVYEAFPDIHVTLEDEIAEGDKVAVRATWRGTHRGPFRGVPPTGRSMTLRGIVIWRIHGGQIAERWAVLDERSLMEQLGGAP